MPNSRRIIFGTQIIPTQTIEMEEASVTHREWQTSPGKALGGNGIASINATQWGDKWISTQAKNTWDEIETNWGAYRFGWDDLSETTTVTSTARQLTSDSNDCAFLYVKNKGDTNEALISLGGESGDYYIIIPAGGSVHLRGTDSLECNEVYTKCNSDESTEIEFVIAKE